MNVNFSAVRHPLQVPFTSQCRQRSNRKQHFGKRHLCPALLTSNNAPNTRVRRTTGLTGRTAAFGQVYECRLRADIFGGNAWQLPMLHCLRCQLRVRFNRIRPRLENLRNSAFCCECKINIQSELHSPTKLQSCNASRMAVGNSNFGHLNAQFSPNAIGRASSICD